jgi:hypothetical protein
MTLTANEVMIMTKKPFKPAEGKTWRGKLEAENANQGKVVRIPPGMQKSYGKGTLLIPKPIDVDAVMRRVRRSRLITIGQIRRKLAKAAKATHACPLTTGIFIRIAAETAEEDLRNGRKTITPYWRTIRDDGTLHEKLPGGIKAQAAKLRREGLTIRQGKRKGTLVVEDFEKRLVKA